MTATVTVDSETGEILDFDGEMADDSRALTVVREPVGLARASDPSDMIAMASKMATALKDIVERQKLYAVIQGKKYPTVEAWMTIARMDNVVAREADRPVRHEDGTYEAFAELVRLSDMAVIGKASAICGMPGDKPWDSRPEYARRSMASTRATSRAFRQHYCPNPDALVLTADLRWVRAGNLKVGDELIGFDESLRLGSQFRRSTVLASEPNVGDLVEVVTSHGSTIVSDLHPFAQVGLRGGSKWTHAKDLRAGARIAYFVRPFARRESFDAGWLAGFLDGEGSVNPKLGVSVAQLLGPTAGRLLRVATAFGFELQPHPRENGVTNFTVYGGMSEWLRMLGSIRPERLLAKAAVLWEGRSIARRHDGAEVLEIKHLGRGEIVGLQTSTSTLIIDGFGGHNSWIMSLAGYEPTPADEMPDHTGGTSHAPARTSSPSAGVVAPPPAVAPPAAGGFQYKSHGVAERGRAPVDGELREGPDGSVFGFSLREPSQKRLQVMAREPIATALATLDDLIGAEVEVHGVLEMVGWQKDGKDMPPFRRLWLDAISAEAFTLPAVAASSAAIPRPAPTPDDEAELDALLA